MSQCVSVKTEIKNLDALQLACERTGTAKLGYASSAYYFKPGWRTAWRNQISVNFPAVSQESNELTGEIEYDVDYGTGHVNDISQQYAVAATILEAERMRCRVAEEVRGEDVYLTLTIPDYA